MMDERDFEKQLRAALRPVDAPPGLAERIIAKAEARSRANRRPPAVAQWVRWGAIAAMLTLVTFLGLRWNAQRQVEELEARRAAEQFALAMQITNKKVTHVQENLVVHVPLPAVLGGI